MYSRVSISLEKVYYTFKTVGLNMRKVKKYVIPLISLIYTVQFLKYIDIQLRVIRSMTSHLRLKYV